MKQIDEGLGNRVRAALALLKSSDHKEEPPKTTSKKAKPIDTSFSPEEEREGDFQYTTAMREVHSNRLAAANAVSKMLVNHAEELEALVAKHGDSLAPYKTHVSNLSRAHKRLNSAALKTAKTSKEEVKQASLATLRGAGITPLDKKTKPLKPANPKANITHVRSSGKVTEI